MTVAPAARPPWLVTRLGWKMPHVPGAARVAGAARGGLRMGLISGVVTVGSDMVEQTRRKGRIDVGQSLGRLGTRRFIGGTAGAFSGGALASTAAHLVPGPLGVVVRPLAAFAGSAVGAEVGAGTWREADWTMVGAQSLGGTAGWMAGSAAGTALATKIGGIIGTGLCPGLGTAIGVGAGMTAGVVGSWTAGRIVDWSRQQTGEDPYAEGARIAEAERSNGTAVQYGDWEWDGAEPASEEELFDRRAEW